MRFLDNGAIVFKGLQKIIHQFIYSYLKYRISHLIVMIVTLSSVVLQSISWFGPLRITILIALASLLVFFKYNTRSCDVSSCHTHPCFGSHDTRIDQSEPCLDLLSSI